MKINELITELNKIRELHGNIDVATIHDEFCCADPVAFINVVDHNSTSVEASRYSADSPDLGPQFVVIG